MALAGVTRHLGQGRFLPSSPCLFPSPVSRVLSPMGCPIWDVGLKSPGLEWGYWEVHCYAMEEGMWGHRDTAGSSWEETQRGNTRGCETDL